MHYYQRFEKMWFFSSDNNEKALSLGEEPEFTEKYRFSPNKITGMQEECCKRRFRHKEIKIRAGFIV